MKQQQDKPVAWIGLGKLGLPMAARLADAGWRVRGCDRDPGRLRLGAERGIAIADDMAAAVAGCPVVFASLPDDRVLREVALGGDLIGLMERGSVLVETSTVSVAASQEVASAAAARGVAYLRSPVSGNPVSAEAGALSALVSGPRDAFDAVRPLLATFTRAQSWLGEEEQGRFAKLAINLMIAVSAGMMGEALAIARRGGIGWDDMLAVMSDSAVGSPMVKYKIDPLAQRDFTATFSCRQIAKDLDLILACARDAGVPVSLAAQMREAYSAIIAMGEGGDDYIATVRHVERLAGLPAVKPDVKAAG
ncbi:NAD(P)-dependent oxidoreductase (plasmid) [Skermanella rosea]|uniref:NAD(P)-dependent oxidoreductase n=1 Tax=Skermanella rosea TaxID=1817965 RepID=UPI0019328E72|nr:NAD(P)-dependent oxidoreductase [Skermanella rosea]UEM07281.1 NAD(P)-dependent oxidoreductase [Skermanella rosea]